MASYDTGDMYVDSDGRPYMFVREKEPRVSYLIPLRNQKQVHPMSHCKLDYYLYVKIGKPWDQ